MLCIGMLQKTQTKRDIRDIDKQKKETVTLQQKINQLEPRLQRLKRDKDKLRHKTDYWKAQLQQLKTFYEEKEIEEVVDK